MKTGSKILIIIIVAYFLVAANFVIASQDAPAVPMQNPPVETLPNPLGENDPRVIVGTIIQTVLGVVGSIALLVFLFGGITWMTAAGSAEKVQKGKQIIIWAALGLAVIFTSYAIVNALLSGITSKPVSTRVESI